MLSRILVSLLNAIIVFIVLALIVAVLVMVGFGPAGIISPFIIPIAIIVGILTFLGAIPSYWK